MPNAVSGTTDLDFLNLRTLRLAEDQNVILQQQGEVINQYHDHVLELTNAQTDTVKYQICNEHLKLVNKVSYVSHITSALAALSGMGAAFSYLSTASFVALAFTCSLLTVAALAIAVTVTCYILHNRIFDKLPVS